MGPKPAPLALPAGSSAPCSSGEAHSAIPCAAPPQPLSGPGGASLGTACPAYTTQGYTTQGTFDPANLLTAPGRPCRGGHPRPRQSP
eukprot:460384-Lingulodinium_polyedra.AAC.1